MKSRTDVVQRARGRLCVAALLILSDAGRLEHSPIPHDLRGRFCCQRPLAHFWGQRFSPALFIVNAAFGVAIEVIEKSLRIARDCRGVP